MRPISTPNPSPASPSGTILSRWSDSSSPSSFEDSPLQREVDQLVTGFAEQATDLKTLASLTAGGLAYRYGRIGTVALGKGHVAAMSLRLLSLGFGLGAEVTAFEFTNRILVRAHGRAPLQDASRLWSWNGPGGWKQALINDTLTFGLLKGAGYLSRESNVVFQHTFSSAAMVGGHQLSSRLGILPAQEGSLAEQCLHAEVTNLQLGAGTSLVHAMAPGVSALERGLDLSLRSQVGVGLVSTPPWKGRHTRPGHRQGPPLQWNPQWALAEGPKDRMDPDPPRGPTLMQMSTPGEDFLTRRSHVTIPFEQGALAIGGRDALNWLLMIRETVEKKEAPEGFAEAPYLWWVPETPEQTYLLNEFGLAFKEDQKDFEPINPEGKIRIRAFMPLLKPGEVFILPEDFGESLKKILDQWSKREKIKLMGKSEAEWLEKKLDGLWRKKEGVIRVDEAPTNRFLIFKNKKRQPIHPRFRIFPEHLNADQIPTQQAIQTFQNQFWGKTLLEMSQWVGPKTLGNLPFGTVISQFLLPGSIITPSYGEPLREKKGVHVFFSQITRSWISDFSGSPPADVTSEFPHYQVGFLERIMGIKPRVTSTIKVAAPSAEAGEAVPQEIPRESAVQNLPAPASLVEDSPQTVQSKERIGVDPTLQMPEELIKQIHLPFDKTNPLGEKAITGEREGEGQGEGFSLRKWLGGLFKKKDKE